MMLTTIDGIPLYSTIAEAVQWASSRNLTGYHTHTHQGQTGYMGGYNHTNATGSARTVRRITRQTSSGSSSSGSGVIVYI